MVLPSPLPGRSNLEVEGAGLLGKARRRGY